MRTGSLILFTLVVLLQGAQSGFAQPADSLKARNANTSIGGQLKGMYISGGISILGGVAVGIIANGFDDYPRTGLPAISGGLTLAPTSLIGLGIGTLFKKSRSNIRNSFQAGVGVSYSSPIFSEYVPGNSHRMGLHLRLQSVEIGNWRYQLGINRFFSEEYAFEGIPAYLGHTRLSWWELHLDLHYLINLGEIVRFYPLAGTQMNQVFGEGSTLKTEILVNYGAGLQFQVNDSWSVFGEGKIALDPDDNPANGIYSFGILYSL